ncbi:MspA family porin [uncultured Gemmiger sp.]|uniref:MspA family porin n=1 Tax=uncultured Gemmiger sp. TaxID=1623490 RepID=UPI0034A0A703
MRYQERFFLWAARPSAAPLHRASANSSVTFRLSPVWGMVTGGCGVAVTTGAEVAVGVAVGCAVAAGAAGAGVGASVGAGVAVGLTTSAARAVSMAFAMASTSACWVMFLPRSTALMAASTAEKSV